MLLAFLAVVAAHQVPEKLMLYCHINRDKFDLPPWSALMSYRVVVTSTQDASLLVRARCTNTSIGLLEHTILPALRPQPQKGTQEARWKVRSRWTHLILDEAGQGTEAELAPALACVLPSRHCAEVEQEVTIVLCGDTQQLGPTITSFEARAQGLDVSLLERLFDRPVYKESMHRLRIARKEREKAQLRGARLQQQEMDEPCAHLVRNYRSQHPSLLMLPSTLFYSDTLIPCAPQTVHLQEWEGLPNKKMPILFEGIESKEEWIEEGVSWHSES